MDIPAQNPDGNLLSRMEEELADIKTYIPNPKLNY
jgi:hypothetical protein